MLILINISKNDLKIKLSQVEVEVEVGHNHLDSWLITCMHVMLQTKRYYILKILVNLNNELYLAKNSSHNTRA